MSLLVLKRQRAEDAHAPEFRYLLGWLVEQTRRVFGEVEWRFWPEGEPAGPLNGSAFVLVVKEANTLCTARSLALMHRAIEDGAELSVPLPVTSFPLHEFPPLYTLRDYEWVETKLLQQPSAEARPADDMPLVLFTRKAFEAAVNPAAGRGATTWTAAGLQAKTAGIYYQFADYYGETRQDLLPHLPDRLDDVLEIGCGRGMTGRWLQEKFGCRVTGVEMNPEIASAASRHLSRVLTGDVQTMAIDGKFDAIIATELFEHLNYPDEFLIKMKGLLKPGGRIVLSVPNVGHYSVVEDLIAGRWDYVSMGILCYTHFRFFTRQTLADWLARVGFVNFRIVPQHTDVPARFQQLPAEWEADIENLRTSGFWVVAEA